MEKLDMWIEADLVIDGDTFEVYKSDVDHLFYVGDSLTLGDMFKYLAQDEIKVLIVDSPSYDANILERNF